MATNRLAYIGNLITGETGKPLVMLGKFAAGSTAPIKKGEIIELTGGGNTQWVPMDSDFAGAGNVAVMHEELKAADRAGYYEIIVPRPGDVFEFELAAASNPSVGASLYWSTSQKLATTGAQVLAYVCGQEHYPQKQGHLSDEPSGDAGTTIRNTSWVRCAFKLASSYFAVFNL